MRNKCLTGILSAFAILSPIAIAQSDAPPPSDAATNVAPAGNFLERFFHAYYADWNLSPSSASEPPAAFRGYPTPVTNPPFPFSVWPYGGSVTIGQPFTQAGPLMQGIWSGPGGDAWKRTGIQINGWLNAGFGREN